MPDAREVRLRREREQRRGLRRRQPGSRLRASQLVVQRNIDDRSPAPPGRHPEAIDRVVVVRRHHQARTRLERECLGEQADRAAGIGREHDVVHGRVRVEQFERQPARGFDRSRAGARRPALGMGIAQHAIAHQPGVPSDERCRVESGACVIEINLARCHRGARLARPQARDQHPRLRTPATARRVASARPACAPSPFQ